MFKSNYRHLRFLFSASLFLALFLLFSPKIFAQETVDKTVATVSDGVRTELITYSDLLWQLALQPRAQLQPPTSDELNRTLQLLINQRLFALEAQRLPSNPPTDGEVKEEIDRILKLFSSSVEFEQRLRTVGFDSISDDNFQRMIRQRIAIEKYLDFRFRSFVVITPEDELKYYREVFTPEFRRQSPGLLLPAIDEVRPRLNAALTENKVEQEIEKFLDDAKRRADVVVLFEV
jgi:hypothetical protein